MKWYIVKSTTITWGNISLKSKSLFISPVGYNQKVYNNKDLSSTKNNLYSTAHRKTSTNITQEGACSGVWNDSVVVIGCSDEESRCNTHVAKLPLASPHRQGLQRKAQVEGRKTSAPLHRCIFKRSLVALSHLHLRCGWSLHQHHDEALWKHAFFSTFTKTSTNTEETSGHIAVHRCWQRLILKAFSQWR
jgi:hypothetical protein